MANVTIDVGMLPMVELEEGVIGSISEFENGGEMPSTTSSE